MKLQYMVPAVIIPILFAAVLATSPRGADVSPAELDRSRQDTPTLRAALTGAEEVGNPGSPRGWGTISITLNQRESEVCYDMKIRYIKATAAHIHRAPKGQNGPARVDLVAPADSVSTACTKVDDTLVTDLAANPTMYYVNVHTAEYPQGAIRGQLAKVTGSTRR